ncbi:rod shape-determining protein MreC [Uliginosibacterium sp. H3]|uniref:Cell shape-determining protein MreC n=1 Tax=Uliginosibacterium silvisoli TaxID=3114758 RepID=A0ABU6JZH5_9RHOO|nr:rod shape-determining protein MreC [Uliginosibacterium sp. H3]
MATSTGHQPPPFFRRGLPLSAKLTIYVALSLALLVGDLQMSYLTTLRQGVAILTYPLQIAAATPAEFARNVSNYFNGLISLQRENERLRADRLQAAKQLLRSTQLEQENTELRGLLDMRERVKVTSIAAEVLFTARDPFSRKVILDKGGNQGVEPGLAVVDAAGVLGQVTRVFPLHAEVTLLSDKEQAIPVLIERSGLRAVMFGTGSGLTELRYLAANADVRVGDRILTSGLDGVFVPGLPVATVIRASRDAAESFGRILCLPIGGVERSGDVLVLGRAGALPKRPQEEALDPRRTAAGRISQRHESEHGQSAPAAAQSAAQAAPAVSHSAPVAAPRPAASAPVAASSAARVVRPASSSSAAPHSASESAPKGGN